MEDIKIHPAANLFPMMAEPEYRQLLEDIRINGVKTYLTFIGTSFEDCQLLDGRNRLKAIQEIGLDYQTYSSLEHPDDIADPIAHVLSLNLHRRHMSESQRAMVANKVAKLKKGRPEINKSIDVFASQSEAADMLHVGVKSVQRARKVEEKAIPEIVEAVERGDVTVSAAAEVAELPKPQQKKLASQGSEAIKKAATENRHKKVESKKIEKKQSIGYFAPLHELFNEMDVADESAVMRFSEWVLTVNDIDIVHQGCRLWKEWQSERKPVNA